MEKNHLYYETRLIYSVIISQTSSHSYITKGRMLSDKNKQFLTMQLAKNTGSTTIVANDVS